jgi:transcription antitermination factor NusG
MRRVEDRLDATAADKQPDSAAADEAIDLTYSLFDLDEKQIHARRKALRSLLKSSEARFEKATRNRPPVLRAGVEVRVLSGPLVGEQGVILDSDYIESRVQLQLPDRPTPMWVAFNQVGPHRHIE